MYRPKHTAIDDIPLLAGTIRQIGFGALVTPTPEGMEISHVPVVVNMSGDQVALETHVARHNAHWRGLASGPSTFIFQGPHAYVSPSFYPTKAEDGKAVPTWNYIVVHAHGRAKAIQDGAWLHEHLVALTNIHEAHRPAPWQVDDAPVAYTAALKRGIVGIRFVVDRLEGKFKLNQEKPEANQLGTIEGLRQEGEMARDLAEALASFAGWDRDI